ncbi:hypothetical protein [Ruegeria hyattellae]|uniref:hypothetical protein n=1 Tax=Ruegeria hyattellae TaxID=3233337 RepID=UPI00355C9456
MASIDKRIDIKKFDKATIKEISTDIVRALTEVAEADPDAEGKFHLKIGHIKVGFSRSGHGKIIIGGGGDDEPETPETPDERG